MRVSLGGIGNASNGETEGVNGPGEVAIPIGTTKRKLKETSNHQLTVTDKADAIHVHLRG